MSSITHACPLLTFRPFLIHCAGLEYIALAPTACIAVIEAMARHNVHGAAAKPLETTP